MRIAEVPCLFLFVLTKIQRDFVGVFNKTIIPLALVGYEMIIANSYPTHPRGIIVKYIEIGLLTLGHTHSVEQAGG